MISKKRIEKGLWWERAWSLVSGCTPVSPGCDNCWAMAMEDRFQGGDHTVRFHEDRLNIPLEVNKPTAWTIWNDLFHPDVPDWCIDRAFDRVCYDGIGHHTFLILTKRCERMAEYCEREYIKPFLNNGNIWLGTTVERPDHSYRTHYLRGISGPNKFLSIEPLLHSFDDCPGVFDGMDGVIVGGESGQKARPCKPEWIKGIIEQCKDAGIPCFCKQLGNNDGLQRYRSKRADEETIQKILGECHRQLPWDQEER